MPAICASPDCTRAPHSHLNAVRKPEGGKTVKRPTPETLPAGVGCAACGHGDTPAKWLDDDGTVRCACGEPFVRSVGQPAPPAPDLPEGARLLGYLYPCQCCRLPLSLAERGALGHVCDLCLSHYGIETEEAAVIRRAMHGVIGTPVEPDPAAPSEPAAPAPGPGARRG